MDFQAQQKLKNEILAELNSVLTTRASSNGAFSSKIEIAVQQFATAITELQNKVDAITNNQSTNSNNSNNNNSNNVNLNNSNNNSNGVQTPNTLTSVNGHVNGVITIATPYDDSGLLARFKIDEDALSNLQYQINNLLTSYPTLQITIQQELQNIRQEFQGQFQNIAQLREDNAKVTSGELLALDNLVKTKLASEVKHVTDVLSRIEVEIKLSDEVDINRYAEQNLRLQALEVKLKADDQSIQALQNSVHELQASNSVANHPHPPSVSTNTTTNSSVTEAITSAIPTVLEERLARIESRLDAVRAIVDQTKSVADQANSTVKAIVNYNDTTLAARLTVSEELVKTLITRIVALESTIAGLQNQQINNPVSQSVPQNTTGIGGPTLSSLFAAPTNATPTILGGILGNN